MKNRLILIVMSVLFISCAEFNKEAESWMNESDYNSPEGKYHFLEKDGTKIFLPEEFERYSVAEYQKVMDSVLEGKAYDFVMNRFNQLKESNGEFYIYYDKKSGATLTVNTSEFMPFSEEEASQLLGRIRTGLKRSAENMSVKIDKVTAKFSGDEKEHVFKAVYQVQDKRSEQLWYSTTYFITANLKTVQIDLTTDLKVEFDPFISKTIL